MPDTRNSGKSEADLATSLANINKQLQTLTLDQKLMSKNIDEKVENLKTAMDEKIDKLRADIHDDLSKSIQANAEKIGVNTKKLSDLERKYEELENSLEFVEKSGDLIVRGIPLLRDEDLQTYYVDIARAIGFTPEVLPRVRLYRLGRKKPGSKFEPPILFKFANRFDKMDFFRAYLNNTNLKLSDIGFGAQTRIYISDNLTAMNRQIFRSAQKLKKDHKIFSAKTISGRVHIRIRENDAPTVISHFSELPSSSSS
jgi:hypothetical protein